MRLKPCLDQGMSKAEIARRFWVSERTIRRWVAARQLDGDLAGGRVAYSARPPVPDKLDAYKGIIDTRLAEFPRLAAQRLFEEVRAAGYAGGYGRVRDYVREVRPREPTEAVVRYETPPGHQRGWTSGRSRCPGIAGMRCWGWWATRDCCGGGSMRARPWRC